MFFSQNIASCPSSIIFKSGQRLLQIITIIEYKISSTAFFKLSHLNEAKQNKKKLLKHSKGINVSTEHFCKSNPSYRNGTAVSSSNLNNVELKQN